MKPIRSARHALMFFGAGAVTAYFLDPAAGPERREKIMQQVRSFSPPAGQASSGEVTSESEGPPRFDSSQGSSGGSSREQGREQDRGSAAHPDESGAIDLATGRPLSESSGGRPS